MKSNAIIITIVIIASIVQLKAQSTFQKHFGTVENEDGVAVVHYQGPTAEYIYTAGTTDTTDTAISQDILLVKSDESGNIIWSYRYGGADDERVNSMIDVGDGLVIAGGTFSYGQGHRDICLLKVDYNGNINWFKTYGGSTNDQARQVIERSNGGYAVAGYTNSYGQGKNDALLLTTDGNGNLDWATVYGDIDQDYFFSLVEKDTTNYIMFGYTQSYSSYHRNLVVSAKQNGYNWAKTYTISTDKLKGKHIIQGDSTSYITYGTYKRNLFGATRDLLVTSLDNSGNVNWAKTYGGSSDEDPASILFNTDSTYLLGGNTESFGTNKEKMLSEINLSGNVQWSHYYEETQSERLSWSNEAIASANNNYYIFISKGNQYTQGGTDIYLTGTNSSGVVYDSNKDSCNFTPFNLPDSSRNMDAHDVEPFIEDNFLSGTHTPHKHAIELSDSVRCDYSGSDPDDPHRIAMSQYQYDFESDRFTMDIFPNPVENKAALFLKGQSNKTRTLGIKVININGQLISERSEAVSAGEYEFKINTKGIEPGMYFVTVNTGAEVVAEKVIIRQ